MYLNIVTGNNELFWKYWRDLSKTIDYQHPIYSRVGLEFYKEYFFGGEVVTDMSFIIVKDDVAMIGIILSIELNNSGIRLSGYGRGIPYIENNKGNISGIKSARKIFRKKFDSIVAEKQIKSILFRDYMSTDGNLSVLARQILDMGGIPQIIYLQLIDLLKPVEEIHSDLSKSCRNGVSWGRKNLEVNHFNSVTITADKIEQLRQLHIMESGRETRSKKSWENLFNIVKNDNGFIIEGRLSGELITSSLFMFNQNICLYSVSATSRSFFNKPIGHAVMWEAINYAKSLGCRYFDFGGLSYNSNNNCVSEKEMNINRFKKSFGGRTKIQLSIDWNTK